jgi:translation initiation factor IF-2
MGGMLSPISQETFIGRATVRQIFKISKIGTIAGCYVTEGVVRRGSKVRILRDDVVVHEGPLKSLKRLKDEAKEVKNNLECGMAFENYNDLREGDVIECSEVKEVSRTL